MHFVRNSQYDAELFYDACAKMFNTPSTYIRLTEVGDTWVKVHREWTYETGEKI